MKLWRISLPGDADDPYREGGGGFLGAVVASETVEEARSILTELANDLRWRGAIADEDELEFVEIGTSSKSEPGAVLCCFCC